MADHQDLEAIASAALSPMKGLALGAPFLGTCFDSMLMGVIICQMAHWLPNSRSDKSHVRLIVGVAAVASLAATGFTLSTYMSAFVYSFGEYSRFTTFKMSGWYGLLDTFVVVPVQIFFAERSVRINNNSLFLLIINSALIAATIAIALATVIVTRGETIFSRSDDMYSLGKVHTPDIQLSVQPVVCTFAHFWLTSTIIYGLYRSRSMSEQANRLLTKVFYMSIESQLPSTVIAIIMIAIIAVDPKSPVIPFFIIAHPKMYHIGLLVQINTRHTWIHKAREPDYDTIILPTYNIAGSANRPDFISLGSNSENRSDGQSKDHHDAPRKTSAQSGISAVYVQADGKTPTYELNYGAGPRADRTGDPFN